MTMVNNRVSDKTVSEIENEFRDCMGQTKKFSRVKKNFFPKYTPPFHLTHSIQKVLLARQNT